MAPPHSASKRLAFLDWTRGFAACIMLQGHVSHSFTHKDLRNDSFYVFSQFFGGLTPAVFTTEPFGAKLPYKMLSPPSVLYALSTSRMQS